MLVERPLRLAIAVSTEGRYAAEMDAGVIGEGEEGRRSSEGNDFDILSLKLFMF